MRVIYDYGINTASASHAAPGASPGRETVLVISVRGDAGAGVAGTADEVSVSDEALSRSREVEAHERSHLALLGGAASSPILYDTLRGPGGEALKVGGSIKVDLSVVPGDPEATERKAQAIIAAANAPNDPSAADMRTAAKAYQLASRAREQINLERSGAADTRA